jgi:hypothetical protein
MDVRRTHGQTMDDVQKQVKATFFYSTNLPHEPQLQTPRPHKEPNLLRIRNHLRRTPRIDDTSALALHLSLVRAGRLIAIIAIVRILRRLVVRMVLAPGAV